MKSRMVILKIMEVQLVMLRVQKAKVLWGSPFQTLTINKRILRTLL